MTDPISTLPDELWMRCFMFLSVSNLGNVQSTCRYWNTLLNPSSSSSSSSLSTTTTTIMVDSWFWKHIYNRRYGPLRPQTTISTSSLSNVSPSPPVTTAATTPVQQRQHYPPTTHDWKSRYQHRFKRTKHLLPSHCYSTSCSTSPYSSSFSSSSSSSSSSLYPLLFHNDSTIPSMYGGYVKSVRTVYEPPPVVLEEGVGEKKGMVPVVVVGGGRGKKPSSSSPSSSWRYFEATVWGMGSVGLVSISTEVDRVLYGAESQLHVGWRGFSYGYHNDDGYVYVPDRRVVGDGVDGDGEEEEEEEEMGDELEMDRIRFRFNTTKIVYGPSWGRSRHSSSSSSSMQDMDRMEVQNVHNNNNHNNHNHNIHHHHYHNHNHHEETDEEQESSSSIHDPCSVIGCGYNSTTGEFFYTLNGVFLGIVPSCKLQKGLMYGAAVSLHECNDRTVLNLGFDPFWFDIDSFCLGFGGNGDGGDDDSSVPRKTKKDPELDPEQED